MRSATLALLTIAALGLTPLRGDQPTAPPIDALHRPYDQMLDMFVRDGFVYYRALQIERGRVDRYLAALNVPAATYQGWSREAQMAFWVNAYNAFVLRTVIDRYPIRGRSDLYPPSSIRQIPGAFDRLTHRAAGRTVTLDEIEKTILPEFEEPRLYLALGRGAAGSGRLRSEAYTESRLAEQLDAVRAEFVADSNMLRIDHSQNQIAVTSILSWHSEAFVSAYDPGTGVPFGQRSPIERALIAFITPHLLPLERGFVKQDRFSVTFQPFNWALNDLTGRER